MPGLLDNLRDRLLKAEKRIRQEDYIPEKKWKKVKCLGCGKTIEYRPRDPANFNGTLLCPHCKTRFKVPSLDEYLNE